MNGIVSSSTDRVDGDAPPPPPFETDEAIAPSSSWIEETLPHGDRYTVNDEWTRPLANLVRIGRMFSVGRYVACVYYHNLVFPKYDADDDDANAFLNTLLPNVMQGNVTYHEAVGMLAERIDIDVNNRQIYRLYKNVFNCLKNDSDQPNVEFQRRIDIKSLKIVNMALETRDDDLTETPALTLAKRCAGIGFENDGLVTLFGTNVLFDDRRTFAAFVEAFSRTLGPDKEFVAVNDNDDDDDDNVFLRMASRIDGIDVYVTLTSVSAGWTFDTDVTRTFVNIPEEPYPFDQITGPKRLCIAVYVADENVSPQTRDAIDDSVTSFVLRFAQRSPLTIATSGFTNFPLIPYNPRFRYVRCETSRLHVYMQRFVYESDWVVALDTARHFPRILSQFGVRFACVIHRPPLNTLPILVTRQSTRVFTLFWSPEDIVEMCGIIVSRYSRNDLTKIFQNCRKIIAFKLYNGYLAHFADDDFVEVFRKYSTLLSLWIGAIRFSDDDGGNDDNGPTYVIKTWTRAEQQTMKNTSAGSNAGGGGGSNGKNTLHATIGTNAFLHKYVNSVNKFYAIRNTFSGRTNLVDAYEISEPSVVFTLIFDHAVTFFEIIENRQIHLDSGETSTNLRTVDSLRRARRLFAFDNNDRNLIEVAADKYVLSLVDLSAIVLIGNDWKETDAVKLTKFANVISRNALTAVQSILCRTLIRRCLLK